MRRRVNLRKPAARLQLRALRPGPIVHGVEDRLLLADEQDPSVRSGVAGQPLEPVGAVAGLEDRKLGFGGAPIVQTLRAKPDHMHCVQGKA
jgi:hypothetical protein